MRNTALVIVLIIIGLLAAVIFFDLSLLEQTAPQIQPDKPIEETQFNDLREAESFLRQGYPETALEIAQRYITEIDSDSPYGEQWTHLIIRTCEECREKEQLKALYEFNPGALDGYEKASLFVAESYLSDEELDNYKRLRERWAGRETLLPTWILLDSDKLLLEGKRGQANNLLAATTFTGKAETERLTRLALLNANENPKASWKYLSTAQEKDPDNADIRFYKAKLLESVGKNQYAADEYEEAVRIEPENLYLQDQLAEFYLRQKKPQKALSIWIKNLQPPTLESIWIKTYFWDKVLLPQKIDWSSYTMPTGKQVPLIKYLIELPENTYWNKPKYSKLALRDYYLETQQATYWLRLLDALKHGHEQEALTLLDKNSFATTSWNPELEYTLKQILVYRQRGRFDSKATPMGLQLNPNESSPFFESIENFAANPEVQVDDELHELLLSKEAFSAALIAASWYEAGLNMHQLPILPTRFPSWVSVNLTKAYKRNRTNIDALSFATLQPPSDPLQLEIGELYIASNDTSNALKVLVPLATSQNSLGARAAYLASLIYLDQGKPEAAKKMIKEQAQLAYDLKGKEVLAKIAIIENNPSKAADIYEAIVENSIDAKAWLMQKAYREKNWDRAKTLTEQLLEIYPDNIQLKQNLQRVINQQEISSEF